MDSMIKLTKYSLFFKVANPLLDMRCCWFSYCYCSSVTLGGTRSAGYKQNHPAISNPYELWWPIILIKTTIDLLTLSWPIILLNGLPNSPNFQDINLA